ncbi:ATP-grasp domain-containing protein [Nocardioides sp. InS609-2]|uniref:ATP-grasp domain-containing protein n=1 Tax=Nocardioides sp. InS609-2 TaxID=2760705 RepID=UPI0020BEF0C2|nr:ATP-grasp domain-containing protein [Nocardioides sp. InS609-2]
MTPEPVADEVDQEVADALTILVIGAYDDLLTDLLVGSPSTNVLLLEEHDRVDRVADRWADHPRVEIRVGDYRHSTQAVDVGVAWHADRPFQAALAGREYAVRPVQSVASALGLKGPGDKAARLCTDKLAFRRAVAGLEITQGRFAAARSPEDVRRFIGRSPVILKPARQHASIGVVRIDSPDDVDRAWRVAMQSRSHEGLAPGHGWDYIVEDLVAGRIEVSLESLVRGGRATFTSATHKLMPPNGGFVPAGHVVPAQLGEHDRRRLHEAESAMLSSIGFEDGLTHSEWILTDGGLHLVECAARYPGGEISRLIAMTTGVNVGDSLARVCAGRTMRAPEPTGEVCAAVFDAGGQSSDGRGSLDRNRPTIVSADSYEALRQRIEDTGTRSTGAGSAGLVKTSHA